MLQTKTPNLYDLNGKDLHVSYSSTSLDGQPTLTYKDVHQNKSFRGKEIRSVECDVGTLISVTLRATPDLGTTTFSLLIPRMQIASGTSGSVCTDGVTTVHSLPFAPQTALGQLDTYSVTALDGTAQYVIS